MNWLAAETRQGLGLPLMDQRTQHWGRDHPAIHQHQRARLHRAGEDHWGEALFCHPTGGEDSIDNRMAAHFCQRQTAHLGKGALVLAEASAPKVLGIGWRIGHLIQRAIAGHQPQAEAKSPRGLLAGHGTTDPLEQVAHQGGT